MNKDSVLYGADAVNLQAGGRGWFSGKWDSITGAVAGATASAVTSLYNTGAWYYNELPGKGRIEELDTAAVLGKLDSNWANYYKENQEVLDTAGFVVGSLIPGGFAIKGLKAVQRAGQVAGTFGTVFGYTTVKQSQAVAQGLKTLAQEGPSVFTTLHKNRLAALGWTTADNLLQAGVFEVATLATMHQAPTLKDETAGDILKDSIQNLLVGGAVGGVIENIFIKSIFTQATKTIDRGVHKVSAVQALEQMKLVPGDTAYKMIDEIESLASLQVDNLRLPFEYKLNGVQTKTELDVGGLATRRQKETVRRGELAIEKHLRKLSTDSDVSAPFAESLLTLAKSLKQAGTDKETVKQELGDVLFNLAKMESIADIHTDLADDLVWIKKGAKVQSAADMQVVQQLGRYVPPNEAGVIYQLKGAAKDMSVGLMLKGEKITNLHAKGMDVVVDPKGGIHINPQSQRIVKVKRQIGNPDYSDTIYHIRTGTTHDRAVATVADLAPEGALKKIYTSLDTVAVGDEKFKFSVSSFTETQDPKLITARHIWAGDLSPIALEQVNYRDFSLLSRAVEEFPAAGVKVKMHDGTYRVFLPLEEDPNAAAAFKDFVFKQKLSVAAQQEGSIDPRILAYTLNVELDWLEKVLAKQWNAADLITDPSSWRKLSSYKQKEHILLRYDVSGLKKAATFPDAEIAYSHRVQAARETGQRIAATVLGPEWSALLPDVKSAYAIPDSTGAGPSGFGASNADYADPLRATMQAAGAATRHIRTEAAQLAWQPMAAAAQQIAHAPKASPELGAILTFLRSTGDKFTVQSVSDGKATTYYLLDHASYLKNDGNIQGSYKKKQVLSQEAGAFLQAYQNQMDDYAQKMRLLGSITNTQPKHIDGVIYAPPVNTRTTPFFAFVQENKKAFPGRSSVSMITARDAAELEKYINAIQTHHPDLTILRKGDTVDYFRAKQQYDFQSGMNAIDMNGELQKLGVYRDFAPTMEPRAVVQEFYDFVVKRSDQLVRNAVQTKYAQEFAELDWLSDAHQKVLTSKVGFLGNNKLQGLDDPFGDYKRMALDISKQSEYTVWNEANQFVDGLGRKLSIAIDNIWLAASKGTIDFNEANKALQRHGLTGPFASQEDYIIHQAGAGGNTIRTAIHKASTLLSTIGLRWDTANSIVTMISSPIMWKTELTALQRSVKHDPDMQKVLQEMTSVAVPGEALRVPSMLKLATIATKNWFGAENNALKARYRSIDAIKGFAETHSLMLEDLALTPQFNAVDWAVKVDKWVAHHSAVPQGAVYKGAKKLAEVPDVVTEKLAKFTGNTFAEEFTRFVSADMMRQITEPLVKKGHMSVPEQDTWIRIFVNRTQGNYIHSQRPLAFQGTIGAALSLFQTYQFNLLQQLYRHIENRDARTIAYFAGLQSATFGLNGLPLFDAINSHLIGTAAINEGHHDAYSSMVRLAGKDWGDWLLYGTASAFPLFSEKAPSLYTRGDLNPRHITILPNPTNPMEVPIVAGAVRVAKAVYSAGKQITAGGDVGAAFLSAMEHQGVSRPLTGLAQIAQGGSTLSKGSLIAAHEDFLSIATMSRLIGAKPMDESITLNHWYRLKAYQAYDRDRIETLGAAVKSKLRNGTFSEEDQLEFMGKYAAAGGNVEGYTKAMARWMKDAQQSEVNRLMQVHKSVPGQRLLEVMGADPLEEFDLQEQK